LHFSKAVKSNYAQFVAGKAVTNTEFVNANLSVTNGNIQVKEGKCGNYAIAFSMQEYSGAL